MSIVIPSRRGFLGGLLGLVAAPAVVKADNIMRVVAWKPDRLLIAPIETIAGWLECNGATVSVDHYPELLSAMGDIYGGDGKTFTVPDLRDRPVIGRIPVEGSSMTYIINTRKWNGMPVGMIMPYVRHGISSGGKGMARKFAAKITGAEAPECQLSVNGSRDTYPWHHIDNEYAAIPDSEGLSWTVGG